MSLPTSASSSNDTQAVNGLDGGSGVFIEPEDGFADDDLLTPSELAGVDVSAGGKQKSYLERDNFADELGNNSSEDPFGEDYSDIARHEIVDVFSEGDLVGRSEALRPVIVIYAYRLPSNKAFDHFKFLRYIQSTLDKLVDLDYTIVYFHYGLRSNNKPSLKWLLHTYQMLDRRYKKNLQALFLVHPTKFIRFVWRVFQPFISLKFEQKMHYVNSLAELNAASQAVLGISFSSCQLPQPIVDYDKSLANQSVGGRVLDHSSNSGSYQAPTLPPRPTQQFNVSLQFILNHNPNCDVPPIVTELITFLRTHGLEVEGIFRRSAPVNTVRMLQHRIDMGEKINFLQDPAFNGCIQTAVIHAAVLLKAFLRSLGEPIITNRLYPELALLSGISKEARPEAVKAFVRKMPAENRLLLEVIIRFLVEVDAKSHVNLMNANNLSVVFGPNLTWPSDLQVPIHQLNNLNSFCYTLILHAGEIFNGK